MLKLRPFQIQAIRALKPLPAHVLCISPTGSGKSLIYEKMITEVRLKTILVTPLVALARQQKQNLEKLGVCVSVNQTPTSKTEAWIVSPESLFFGGTAHGLSHFRPDLLVVDECHCLWDWGEKFRPEFSRIPELIRGNGIRRSLWLTATLPKPAREALRAEIDGVLTEIGEFRLPENLDLHVMKVSWAERSAALLRWTKSTRDAGIVFVTTRESSERVARLLNASGRRAIAYHAGMSREERQNLERQIAGEKVEIIVATSAFGMGMHHPFLKWAVLWQAPPSLLALAQTLGRVGRNHHARGNAQALVFWDYEDFKLLEWMVENSPRRKSDLTETLYFLKAHDCRRNLLNRYFGSTPQIGNTCDRCDVCDLRSKPSEFAYSNLRLN